MKLVKQLILNIVINWGILFIIYRYIPELWFSVSSSWFSVIITFGILWFMFWIVNSVIKSIIETITLPIKYLTFWLSSLIINIWVFYFFRYLVEIADIWIKIQLGNLLQIVLMAIVITIIYFLTKKITK